ncbi:unnamed protein product, partial [Symbiodinium necroappetens]
PSLNLKFGIAGNQETELQEAAVHELDAAVDRLVSKVNLALEGSIGHAAAGSLQ